MVAAYINIFYGEKVDIITSNHSLAERDSKGMELFFKRLGIRSFYFTSNELSN